MVACGHRAIYHLNRTWRGCPRTEDTKIKIHEYQAKEILARYGVPVPRGEVANTFDDAAAVVRKLFADGVTGVAVKAQIHAGGRGKGGGV